MKTKTFILLIVLTCYSFSTKAQLWTKYYDGACNSFKQTNDGGYVFTGNNSLNTYLARADSLGDTLWTKTFNIPMADYGESIIITFDGYYVIAGRTFYDAFILKTDINGDTLWYKTYGGSGEDEFWGLTETSDGGYAAVGNSNSFGPSYDIWLVRTNKDGDTLWTKTFPNPNWDYSFSVQETTDGGLILGCTKYISDSASIYNYDTYLIKTNGNGDTLWTKTYGGNLSEDGFSVQQTTDGGYIVTGGTYSFGNGQRDIYLVKTNSTGDTLWTKTYGWADDEHPWEVQQTIDGGYIIVGNTESNSIGFKDILLIKTDTVGDTLWTRTFGMAGETWYGKSVQQTTDGGFIVGGLVSAGGLGGGVLIKLADQYSINNCSLSILFSSNNVICNGANDGQATAIPSGGTVPFTYLWSDSSITESIYDLIAGTYTVTVTDSNGCAALDSITIDELPLIFTSTNAAICDNDSLFLQGAYQNTLGLYYDTLLAGNSCDSILITDLTLDSILTKNFNIEICEGDSALAGGIYQVTSGIYYDTLIAMSGCDSIVIIDLTVDSIFTQNLNLNICAGDSMLLGGNYQTTSGIYYDTLTAVNNCDSIVGTTLTVDTCTGIFHREEDGSIHHIIMYPNPNSGEFNLHINFTRMENFEIVIYNTLGQTVFFEKVEQFQGISEKQLDLRDYPAGVYNIQLKIGKSITTELIIIE